MARRHLEAWGTGAFTLHRTRNVGMGNAGMSALVRRPSNVWILSPCASKQGPICWARNFYSVPLLFGASVQPAQAGPVCSVLLILGWVCQKVTSL